MAKTPAKTETLPATVKESLPAEAAYPDFLSEYQGPLGTENIDTADLNIPRLKLGQGLTPEVKDGLVKDGDIFHSITKEVLIPVGGTGIVIPVSYHKEYILWRDRADGGGIFARAKRVKLDNGQVRYEWDHPNTEFVTKVKGVRTAKWKTARYIEQDGLGEFGSMFPDEKDSPPAATAHFNYLLVLPDHGHQLVAVSFSRSSGKKAKDFNSMLKIGNAPMFARRFRLGAVPEQNDKGDKFFNYSMAPAGFVQDAELFKQLLDMHKTFSERGINVDFSDEEGAAARDDEAGQF